MSLRQIFSRIEHITRSYTADGDDDAGALRRAEDLIDEANNAWELPEPPAQGEARSAPGEGEAAGGVVVMTYERACLLLEVPQGAAIEEVTRAYRRIIVRHHPDHAAGGSIEDVRAADRRTQELNHAYAFLKDHAAR